MYYSIHFQWRSSFKEQKKDFVKIPKREMGSIVFHCQSPLPYSSCPAVGNTNLRRQNYPRKEIADGAILLASPIDHFRPFALSIQADGDRRGISFKTRISALGRKPKDHGNNAQHSSGAKSSKNQEIISLLKRIRSSIAKGSASLKGRNNESSNEKGSLESVLEVLRQSRTPEKTARKARKKSSTRQRDSSSLTRPPSNFVRRSPIPSSNQKESPKLRSLSLHATRDENTTQFQELKDAAIEDIEKMKLPQLKELAKSRGIKGYSRVKKTELIKLLSPS